jgi:hypothetical protein
MVAGLKKLTVMITTFALKIGVNLLLVVSINPPKILVKISVMFLLAIL